jgi:hypothetical protein
MPQIMCGQNLWRALGPARQARQASAPAVEIEAGRLGNWAAIISPSDAPGLAIAMNERTRLTLVFPFAASAAVFRRRFQTALVQALHDHRIPENVILVECAALKRMPLVRLVRQDTLREALSHVAFICAIELSHHSNLRLVQWNLNDFPHNVDPGVPHEAVVALLGPCADRRVAPATVHGCPP